MDPRYLRSERALRDAVLVLAAERAVNGLSVAEVCRRAGVTRDTFYRHAESPLALLAAALDDGLALIVSRPGGIAGEEDSGAGIRESERQLLGFVAAHAEIYRQALQPHMLAGLRAGLESRIRDSLLDHLMAHPEILPPGVDREDARALRALAAYAAAGTVGAIEIWLEEEPLDIERGMAVIFAASPEFWIR